MVLTARPRGMWPEDEGLLPVDDEARPLLLQDLHEALGQPAQEVELSSRVEIVEEGGHDLEVCATLTIEAAEDDVEAQGEEEGGKRVALE